MSDNALRVEEHTWGGVKNYRVLAGDRALGDYWRHEEPPGYVVTFPWLPTVLPSADAAETHIRVLDAVARHAGDLEATIAALIALREKEA